MANSSFGISLSLLREGQERVLEHHRSRDVAWVGNQAMYFETGQGSALSAVLTMTLTRSHSKPEPMV